MSTTIPPNASVIYRHRQPRKDNASKPHLQFQYSDMAAQVAGVPLPAQPDAATRARERLERRRRAFGGTLAGMWHEITYNASKHARGLIFCVTVAMVAWAALSVVILAKASGGQVVTPVPTFAPIVSVTPIVTQSDQSVSQFDTPTATPQPTAEPTATATPDATSGQAQAISRACLLRIEAIGAGEFQDITDTYTLRAGMAQIVNTAVESNCATDESVAGSLFNRWYGYKPSAVTQKIIDATYYALEHPSEFQLYNLFGSQTDLHTWYKSSIGDECIVAQTYPIGWANPQILALRCRWGK